MEKRTTTVRMPEDLAERADVIARGRGISVNALMLEAPEARVIGRDATFQFGMETLTAPDGSRLAYTTNSVILQNSLALGGRTDAGLVE